MLTERMRSRAELISELSALRLKIADLERIELLHERAVEDLTGKRKEYRTIFDSMPARVMYLNPEGKVLRVNSNAAKALGLKPGEIIGKYLHDFLPAEEAARLVAEQKAIIASGEARFGLIEQVPDAAGKPRWLRVDKILYRDRRGNIIGVIVFAVDITDHFRTEKALQETEERLRYFMEYAPIYVFFKDHQIRSLQLSKNYETMLGRPMEELIGKTMDDLFPSDLAKSMIEDDLRVIREGKPIKVEEEFNGRFYTTTKFPIIREGKPPLLAGFTIDITDRKHSETSMQETVEKLRKLTGGTIHVINMMIAARAPFTSDHQKRVADLARAIGTEMRLSPGQIDGIRAAGSLHDVGMIAIPGEILSAPRKLTDYEFGLIKTHTVVGHDILKGVEFPWLVADIVVQHHERLDGSGYPHGIRGEAILLEARILGVADVVEAIASHRPWRPALGVDAALEIIGDGRGNLYDPDVVDACGRLFREKGFQLKEG